MCDVLPHLCKVVQKHKAHRPISNAKSNYSYSEATLTVFEIFSRSFQTRWLQYTTFVGDTVSTSARSGRQCTTNLGLIMFTRNECVAHVYKSLETALRHYKNSITGTRPPYSKGIGGKGCLTDKWLTTCKIMLRPLGRTQVICKEWNTSVAIKQQILVNEHLPLKSNTSIVPKAKLHSASFGRTN